MRKILVLILLILNGCSSKTLVTDIQPKFIKPEIIEDTLDAKIVTDTLISTNEVVKKDTVKIVKYFPRDRKFYIKVKPDSILLIDTVKITTIREIERKENNTMIYFAAGALTIVILQILLNKFGRK
jgi:hypothetical protein